jgi:hypothetical protein
MSKDHDDDGMRALPARTYDFNGESFKELLKELAGYVTQSAPGRPFDIYELSATVREVIL